MAELQANRLLVVDDEEPNRDLLSRRLRKAGFEVEMAASAQEALAVIEREKIDLILLDYMMPEMNGIDLLRLLRATQSQSDLPVIMVTAVNDSARVVEALSTGANDYVTKPIDFPVTLARVEAQLIRRDADRLLRASEERLSMAVTSNQSGIFDWNLNTGEFYASKEWQTISGLTDWEGGDCEFWLSRLHPRDSAALRESLSRWKSGEVEDRLEWESRMRQADGNYRVLQMRATVQRNKQGNPERLVGAILDITRAKYWNEAVGLENRLRLLEELEEPRTGQVLMILSVDRFKLVSDSMGAAAGQKLIVEMAERISTVLGKSLVSGSAAMPLLTYIDADQIGILLESEIDGETAEETAEYLITSIEVPLEIEGRKLFSSANLGLVRVQQSLGTPEDLILMATTALGQAKLEGRGQIKTFEEKMRGRGIERLELENDLRLALERNQFVVFYQAKIDLKKGSISGFEALLRWRHPVRGLVPPDKFIPIAEDSGMMIPLGAWVLREASQTMQRWRQEFPERPEMEISVNVSAYQLKDD
ncbi:MAG: response regulator, partial [Acidobacteria bacterium]|nr:response regulator [Acidobacteriota bacterium]